MSEPTKQDKIQALAEVLRSQLATKSDLEQAMTILFKGQAEVSTDNDGQLLVYTGHKAIYAGDVTCIENQNYLDAD